MNKLNPEIYKLLETVLWSKNHCQGQNQGMNQSSQYVPWQDSQSEDDGIPSSEHYGSYTGGEYGSSCYQPHCREKCPPHCVPKCPPHCEPKCPPHCVPKCPPHCEPKCPPHCLEKHPPQCSEPWPWEKSKTIIDNKINCGCRKPYGPPPDEGEYGNGDDLRDGQRRTEDNEYAPESWQEDGKYSPIVPGEPDFQREDGDDHGKPVDKDKKIIIENIVNCGSRKPHCDDDVDCNGNGTAFAYLYFLLVGGATVVAGADVPFNEADPVNNMVFSSPQVTIQKAGNYKIYYGINGNAVETPAQIALTVNGVPQSKTFIPVLTTAGEYSGEAILTLNTNDVLTLRNVPGGGDIAIAAYSNVGAQLVPSYLG